MNNRENWSGHLGFVIAAAASAVGLGNLWRFPSSAATYGGGIFLLIYIALFFGFGLALMITEISIGRSTQLSPAKAFTSLSRKWSVLGWLSTLVPVLIMPYYCVIGGWVTKYFVQYTRLLVSADTPSPVAANFFSDFISSPMLTLSYSAIFAAAVFFFIVLGVKKGIERSNKVMMPALLFLTIAIAVFVCCQPGSLDGLKYFLIPDFSRLMDNGHISAVLLAKTVLSAMGQLFFSLSLAMGIMITYGSYVPKNMDLRKAALKIGLCDTFVALLAGLIVIPAAYAFGGEELATKAGPSLMFVSLPQVFASMPYSTVLAFAFFVLVLFAALTSAMSIAETIVSSLCDRYGWSRKLSTSITMVYTFAAAVPSAVSLVFLDRVDFFVNSILMPIVAFMICVFVGWILKPCFVRDEVTRNGEKFSSYRYYHVLIRYIAPVLICIILITYTLNGLGLIDF